VKEVLDWSYHIALAIIIGVLIVSFVGQRTIVIGHSMEPTLHDSDQLIIEKLTTRFGKLNQGDIVTIFIPEKLEEGEDYIIKRVIGVEGDKVQIKDGKIYVNDKQIDEDYTSVSTTLEDDPQNSNVKVGEGQIFVLGDNRQPNASKDSRTLGLIDIKKVRGRAIFRFYPFNTIGGLDK
jgi:signal peptidase I